MLPNTTTLAVGLLLAFIAHRLWTIFYKYALHPLAKFPGPKSVCTGWFKCINEIRKDKNWTDTLRELHKTYDSDVVRCDVNELHFSNPSSYHEIYNNVNKWDKEARTYQTFAQDRSSFGFLTYREAKARKDVLAPFFSKRSILETQDIVKHHLDRLCISLNKRNGQGKSSDMLFAMRAFSLDCIVAFCFAQDVHATEAEGFRHPITVAMNASLPATLVFKHFPWLRRVVFGMPGWMTKVVNPAMGGLVDFDGMIAKQLDEVLADPGELKSGMRMRTIYSRLLDPEANKAGGGVPSRESLFEEAKSLFFGGAESAGNVVMLGVWYVKQDAEVEGKLREELRRAWTKLGDMPPLEELEKLPYLTAVIRESLRVSPSVPCPLPRVVPSAGAVISGKSIPPGTVVAMGLGFVHNSPEIFPDPKAFKPERWLQSDSGNLDKWLVAFTKGPRNCIGQNLAMCELYMAFAVLFRKFEVELDGTKPEDVTWKECFLPHFSERHMKAFCRPLEA